jgi:hypothetical protein
VGLRAAAVVRLEGALAHSGAPGKLRARGDRGGWIRGRRLAVTVRPRVARNARVCTALDPRLDECADLLPFGGMRQQPSTTRPRYGTRACVNRSNCRGRPAERLDTAGAQGGSSAHAQPVDNDLNGARRPDYRD